MKQIVRRKGKHLGTHYIFEDYSEAVKYLSPQGELAYLNVNGQDTSSLACFPHWMDNISVNDWVTADDGKVLQVLSIYRMNKGRGRRPLRDYELVNVKTAAVMGYYMKYYKSEGREEKCINRCNLVITEEILTENTRRHSMSLSNRNYKLQKIWKRTFVYYLVIYLSPVFAYQLMIKAKHARNGGSRSERYHNFHSAHKYSHELLKDPFVIKELEKYMKVDTFRDRLSSALKSQGIDEERIVQELSDGLTAVRKGTQTHKQFIELAVNMSRYAEDKENIGPDGKVLQRIETADYSDGTMLPPPPAAILGNIDGDTRELVYKSIGDAEENDLPTLSQLEGELGEEDIAENTINVENITENIAENTEKGDIDNADN